jgi:hypothetical protein
MSEDIVTRLRKAVAQTAEANTLPSWDFATVVWEAADEIERLTEWQKNALLALDKREAEIGRLRAEVVRLGSFLHPIGLVIDKETK